MLRPISQVALAVLLLLPSLASAQTGEALIRKLGTSPYVSSPTFRADTSLEYKVAWDVTKAPEKAGAVVDGFRSPANFLVLSDQEGVSRQKVKLAVIVFGGATQSLLANAAYKEATGADNESIPLLEALHAAGVRIIVCGQALINRNVPRESLLPFVEVTTSATMARATLAAQGYATFQ